MSDTQPIDTDEVQSLAQDAMEKRPWPHVDAVLYPDKSQHTADELRKEAHLTFTERARSMLRAGADAMDRVAHVEETLSGYKRQRDYDTQRIAELIERGNKAEAMVKVLEEALQKCRTELYWCAKQLESHGHAHRDGDSVDVALKLAAAALQVKP